MLAALNLAEKGGRDDHDDGMMGTTTANKKSFNEAKSETEVVTTCRKKGPRHFRRTHPIPNPVYPDMCRMFDSKNLSWSLFLLLMCEK